MKSICLIALLGMALAGACRNAANSPIVATANGKTLTVDRFADLAGNSQMALERGAMASVAELWVDYQLLGLAAAKVDSLSDPRVMDAALWSNIGNLRLKKLEDAVSRTWKTPADIPPEERYASGEAIAARQILVRVDSGATPVMKAAALRRAQAIRNDVTVANFAQLAARSEDTLGARRGGNLGMFPKGIYPPEFEGALLALKPGELSRVVETRFGYHIFYRMSYAEVKDNFLKIAAQRNVAIAESTYIAGVESAGGVQVVAGAAPKVRGIAVNPRAHAKDRAKIATYKGGALTAARLASWIAAFPPTTQVRVQVLNSPDSQVVQFVRQIARNELLLLQADSAKVELTADDMAGLHRLFLESLATAWTELGVVPARLADSARTLNTAADSLAATRLDAYFDRLTRGQAPLVIVSYPISQALRTLYPYTLNDAVLDRVIAKARSIRELKGIGPGAAGDSQKGKPATP